MFPINAVIAEALKVKRKRKRDGSHLHPAAVGSRSPPLSLDKAVLLQIRDAVQREGDEMQKRIMLEEVHRQLFLELRRGPFSSRLKSLLLVDFLFTRSTVFRDLACQDLRTLVGCSQCAGLPFLKREDIRTPAKEYQVEVRDASLRMIEIWDSKYDYPPLRAMARYLRESLGIQMPNVAAELRAQQLHRHRTQAIAQWRVLNALELQGSLTLCATAAAEVAAAAAYRGTNSMSYRTSGSASGSSTVMQHESGEGGGGGGGGRGGGRDQLREAEACLQQLEECFRVLFPGICTGTDDARNPTPLSLSSEQWNFHNVESESVEDDDESSKEEKEDPEDEEVDVEWEDADFEDRKDNDSVASTKRANDYDEQGCSRHDSNEDDGASLHSSKRLQKRCLGLSEQQEQLDAARLSMPFTMSININLDLDIGAPDSGAVTDNENTGNMILAHMVEELSRQLHISFLPMLKRWRALFDNTSALEWLLLLGTDGKSRGHSSSDASESRKRSEGDVNKVELITSCCLQAKQRLQLLVERAEDILNKCKVFFSSRGS